MSTPSIRTAVETQARALVRGDAAAFASHCTPAALVQMNAAPGRRPRRYRVDEIEERDTRATSLVRFSGGRTEFAIREIWELRAGGWIVVEASVTEMAPSPWWRRVFSASRPVDDLRSERAR